MNMKHVKFAVKRLIDSVWTMSFTVHPDQTVTVHEYSREDENGYKYERMLPKLNTIEHETENSARTLVEIEVDDVIYPVRNRQNIFSYKL